MLIVDILFNVSSLHRSIRLSATFFELLLKCLTHSQLHMIPCTFLKTNVV